MRAGPRKRDHRCRWLDGRQCRGSPIEIRCLRRRLRSTGDRSRAGCWRRPRHAGNRPAGAAQYGADGRRHRPVGWLGLRARRSRRRPGGAAPDGRGFPVGNLHIPIVPAAILFDLINGGDKDWGLYPLSRTRPCSHTGRRTGIFDRHGRRWNGRPHGHVQGRARYRLDGPRQRHNHRRAGRCQRAGLSAPSVTAGIFWAAPFEDGAEFGGLGMPHPFPKNARDLRIKFRGSRAKRKTPRSPSSPPMPS